MTSLAETFENTPAEIVRGIVILVVGSAIIPLLDAFGKILVTTHDISAGEVALVRLFSQAAMILPFLLYVDGPGALKTRRLGLNLLRGACLGLAGLAFFAALRFMPLADATAVFLIEPMILTLLAAFLLKETIGWRRIVAVVVGFFGALIIIRPSYSVFGIVSLLPVAAAFFVALYLILTRRASRGSTPLAMLFYAGAGGVLVLLIAMIIGHPLGIADLTFRWPDRGSTWMLLIGAGLIGTAGHLMFIQAYKLAPASVLAPFGYVEIVSAVFLGYLIFADMPDGPKWLGMAIIVGSGLFIYFREQRIARHPQKPPIVR
ncbi:DMT family transporter [Aurantimonas sp. C2-6-R+9]|uniref:DMT family transporter n=1 Tax=unclassified Aurantimonas TaxID=2638230 RepID=UPI002E19F34F|nr:MULTISPECIES: DMT family transporter [unclassified Aurantimonas]MEC5290432.1 DMT family transporter [Aurantimonas sp. C2-3-R2]MEC5380560.1 DMT family transporter [Aurantimonas sp. C2-6-R+9]MEC5411600.1 DMT family transporter [Aurantimonas sp. C2-4-R8]